MLLSPLLYIKYYQTDLQLASDHLGKYCVLLSVVGYGAPLVSLVSILSLMLSTLGKIFSRQHFEMFFLFFPEKKNNRV